MSGLSERDVERLAAILHGTDELQPSESCAVCAKARSDARSILGSAWMTERDAAVSAEAKAEHRQEWADYFAHWDGAVGTEPLTVEKVIDALRGEHLPFGTSDGGDQ